MTPEEQLEALAGDASELVSPEELLAKLKLGRPLRIKYGPPAYQVRRRPLRP